jgi:hypothetical protein
VTGTRGRVAQLVLIIVGMLLFAYPLTVGAASPINCRGVSMGPGDTCAKAGTSATQSYEQRAQARRNAAPVIMVVGVLVMAFGVTLLITGRRRVAESR